MSKGDGVESPPNLPSSFFISSKVKYLSVKYLIPKNFSGSSDLSGLYSKNKSIHSSIVFSKYLISLSSFGLFFNF